MSNTIQIATGAAGAGFCLSASAHPYGALRTFAKPATGAVVRDRMPVAGITPGTHAWRPPV